MPHKHKGRRKAAAKVGNKSKAPPSPKDSELVEIDTDVVHMNSDHLQSEADQGAHVLKFEMTEVSDLTKKKPLTPQQQMEAIQSAYDISKSGVLDVNLPRPYYNNLPYQTQVMLMRCRVHELLGQHDPDQVMFRLYEMIPTSLMQAIEFDATQQDIDFMVKMITIQSMQGLSKEDKTKKMFEVYADIKGKQ